VVFPFSVSFRSTRTVLSSDPTFLFAAAFSDENVQRTASPPFAPNSFFNGVRTLLYPRLLLTMNFSLRNGSQMLNFHFPSPGRSRNREPPTPRKGNSSPQAILLFEESILNLSHFPASFGLTSAASRGCGLSQTYKAPSPPPLPTKRCPPFLYRPGMTSPQLSFNSHPFPF